MTNQILKKEMFTLSMEYIESLKTLMSEEEYSQAIKLMQSQKFLNLIDKLVSIYAKYLDQDQMAYILSSFQQSKPILRALIKNMPAIVLEMDSFLKEEKLFDIPEEPEEQEC